MTLYVIVPNDFLFSKSLLPVSDILDSADLEVLASREECF